VYLFVWDSLLSPSLSFFWRIARTPLKADKGGKKCLEGSPYNKDITLLEAKR
jgi:hypothetical protein